MHANASPDDRTAREVATLRSCEHSRVRCWEAGRVAELAEKHGVARVHIALAWLLQKPPVTAPIIGATKISHLEAALGALSVKLAPEEAAYLEEPYVPHRIVGHQ